MRYGRAVGVVGMGVLFAVGVVAASAVNNVATATVTTEYHTYTDTVTVSAKGKEWLFTVEGTITDPDTIPDPVTVTVTTGGTPSLPVAAYTMTPASPWVGATVTFDGSSSLCADVPCTYQWVDDGPDGPAGTQWTLCASGVQCVFTFTEPGTIRARLNLRDASGDVSTVMRQFTLLAAPPSTTSTTTAPTTTGGHVANVWVVPS